MTKHYNLIVSYTWEYDKEFADKIKFIFDKEVLDVLIFSDDDLLEVEQKIENGELTSDLYLDRASDVDENYNKVAKLLGENGTYIINPQQIANNVVNKAYMQKKLDEAALPTPKTIIIPPLEREKKLTIEQDDIETLGIPFIVKPCYYTGGSEGVIKDAAMLDDIGAAREVHSDDHYLAQEKIYPTSIEGKRAWLRLIWAFGKIIPTWWDDLDLRYTEFSESDFEKLEFNKIEEMVRKVAEICQLDYFSTELAINDEGKCFLIDYVNDQCDMRLQSLHPDGVPDKLVDLFIYQMIEKLKEVKKAYHPQ